MNSTPVPSRAQQNNQNAVQDAVQLQYRVKPEEVVISIVQYNVLDKDSALYGPRDIQNYGAEQHAVRLPSRASHKAAISVVPQYDSQYKLDCRVRPTGLANYACSITRNVPCRARPA
jgi:hypothetical protein